MPSKEAIEDLFSDILDQIPFLDRSDPNLRDTPSRVAKMYKEVFWGLDPDKTPRVTTFPVDSPANGMIGTGKIFFSSFCAHHFLPFTGHAHIFYIPHDRIIGLSKFTRIVNYFSARPQLQERLSSQIADFIMDEVECVGCLVVMRATHTCMQCRGVRQEAAVMVTSVIRPVDDDGLPDGPFAFVEPRAEAMAMMEMDK